MSPPSPNLVNLERVHLAYGLRTLLDGVSLGVGAGERVGVVGRNGGGKTTLLQVLAGRIEPDAGRVTAARGGTVGLLTQRDELDADATVRHQVLGDRADHEWAADARARDVVTELLAGLDLDRVVGALSGGERRRTALASLLLTTHDLLVLDEPTNGLDPPQIHAMREVLRRYAAGGRTVLVSSHLLAEVEQTCDHVVVMHKGLVVADGTVEEIISGGGAATFAVDEPDRAAAVLGGLDGVHAVQVEGSSVHAQLNGTPRASAVRALVGAGVDVAAAGPRRRLEDAFLQLVGEDPS